MSVINIKIIKFEFFFTLFKCKSKFIKRAEATIVIYNFKRNYNIFLYI